MLTARVGRFTGQGRTAAADLSSRDRVPSDSRREGPVAERAWVYHPERLRFLSQHAYY